MIFKNYNFDFGLMLNEIKKGLQRTVIDFDNHFEDSTLDFTNQ